MIFNKSIICPQASTAFLNRAMINDYFLLNDQIVLFPTDIDFHIEVKIKGNLNTEQHVNETSLHKLVSDAIMRLENFIVTTKYLIEFKENLLVNHCTMQINTNIVVRNSTMRMGHLRSSQKYFKQFLNLSKNVLVGNSNISDIKIHGFKEDTLFLSHLNSIVTFADQLPASYVVIFENYCSARSVITNRNIEKKSSKNADNIFERIFNFRERRIQLLMVYGHVAFNHDEQKLPLKNMLEIKKLNDVNLFSYFKLIVYEESKTDLYQNSKKIGGEKTFIFELNTTFAVTYLFNKEIEIRNWLESAVRQQHKENQVQQISSLGWEFFTMTTDNFQTKRFINNIQFSSSNKNESRNIIIINDNPSITQTITSDISFSIEANIGSNSVVKSSEIRPCNLVPFLPKTLKLLRDIWTELNVIGNLKILSNEKTIISTTRCVGAYCLFESALSSQLDENVNTNIVFNFKGNNDLFSFDQISVTDKSAEDEVSLINNIKLKIAFNDAVKRTMNNLYAGQSRIKSMILGGPKEFFGAISGESNIQSSNQFLVDSVNGVGVTHLNYTLFTRDLNVKQNRNTTEILYISVFQSLLFFDAPLMETIKVEQRINGIPVADIYFLYSKHTAQSIKIIFKNFINPFHRIFADQETNLSLVNDMSLKFFLNNRCKRFVSRFSNSASLSSLNKPQVFNGYLTFENVILYGDDIKIERINDVICDEIVLKESSQKQDITEFKEISGEFSTLHVENPFHVWKSNNIEFVSIYAKAILLNNKQLLGQCLIRNPNYLESQKGLIVQSLSANL